MSGVKITGMNKLMAELNDRFGKENMVRISDAALLNGAKIFVKN
jgi:hypothetical protein